MSEKKELKAIDPEVLAISELNKGNKFNTDGTGELGNSEIYIEAAKLHGITEEDIKKQRNFDELFSAGVYHSVGMDAIPFFKENPEVAQVKVPVKLTGRDKAVVTIKRHVTTVNPKNREETTEHYGTGFYVTHFSAGNKDAGAFGVVYQHVKNEAAAALKDL